MAYIQEKSKGKKIISFKFKTYLDRDENGKQIVKCMTWYPEYERVSNADRKIYLFFSSFFHTSSSYEGFFVSIAYQKIKEKEQLSQWTTAQIS